MRSVYLFLLSSMLAYSNTMEVNDKGYITLIEETEGPVYYRLEEYKNRSFVTKSYLLVGKDGITECYFSREKVKDGVNWYGRVVYLGLVKKVVSMWPLKIKEQQMIMRESFKDSHAKPGYKLLQKLYADQNKKREDNDAHVKINQNRRKSI